MVNADLKREFMEENIDLSKIATFFRIPGDIYNIIITQITLNVIYPKSIILRIYPTP